MGWRVPGRDARLIVVHPDTDRIDRRLPPVVGVVADVEQFLLAAVPACAAHAVTVPTGWLDRARRVDRAAGPLGDPVAVDNPPLDALLMRRAIEAVPDSWVVTMDPGLGPLSLSAPAELNARFLYPTGFGAMGFAVPCAIGSTFADGVDGALAVVGYGSLFMSLPSLESIAGLGVPVVVLVLDDGGFGSQRKKQREGYGRNVGVDYDNPDIAAIASAMRIEAQWIEDSDEVTVVCDRLRGRPRGAVFVVRRNRKQPGSWYEGTVRQR